MLLLLVVTRALQSADLSAVGATARVLHTQLGLSRPEIGTLSSVSAIVGVVATIPAGIAADRWHRVRLMRYAVALWTLGMIWVGATSTFAQMLPARAALGALIALVGPVAVSLVGDTVPVADRGWVFGRILAAELVGSALGVTVSGELAGLIDWRWAFWWLAAAGVLALVVSRGIGEPPRRDSGQRGQDGGYRSTWRAFPAVLRIRTNVLLIVASALGYFYLDGIATFGFPYLHDRFGIQQTVAPFVLLALGAAAVVGVLVGSRVGDRWAQRRPTGRVITVLVPYCAAVVLIVPAMFTPTVAVALVLLLLGAASLGAVNPNLDAARVDIVPQPLLGRAESVRSLLRSGADASAPVTVGLLAAGWGLSTAFQVLSVPLILAAVLGALALRSYPRDAAAARSSSVTSEVRPPVP